MGALVGLGVGVGLLLVWSAFALPRTPSRDVPRPGRVRRQLSAAGLDDVSVTAFVALCGLCGVLAALVVQVVSQTPPVAVAFGLIAAYLPFEVLAGRARRRLRERAEVWPEAIDNLASAVRAGLSLPDALAGLGERGPEPLRPAFDAFALDYQVTGRFGESLDRLKDRLADPVGDRVVEGLRIAREVGGGELGRLLRNLSGYLRDDLRTRSELESRQAWAVNSAHAQTLWQVSRATTCSHCRPCRPCRRSTTAAGACLDGRHVPALGQVPQQMGLHPQPLPLARNVRQTCTRTR